jgi:hypothetical protein
MRAPFQEGDFPGPVKYGYLNVGVVEQGPPRLRGRTAFCLYPQENASERTAGRPRIGLANGWFYKAASQAGAFFDITTGSNDPAGVGCCQATVGYDPASGLGVPNWAVVPATLPQPG